MLPNVTLEARVVADPELRFSPSGVAVGSIRTVCSSRKKEGDEWVDDKVLWLDVTCFKTLAENVAESVAKGDIIVATGNIYTDEWTTPEGEKRSKVRMNANTVSVSLQFRTVPHGGGRTERTSAPTGDSAGPTLPDDSEPPF